MRVMEEYRSAELFKIDLQSNLRTYINDDKWQQIKPKRPLPWDYSDMLTAFQKYTKSGPSGANG